MGNGTICSRNDRSNVKNGCAAGDYRMYVVVDSRLKLILQGMFPNW
jgi:hypothetical protein